MPLVNDFLEQSAMRTPDKVALVCDGRRLSYAEIDAKANRLANGMRDHGLRRGDRVILCLPNSVELVVAIFATLKAEGVFVVVNPATRPEKLLFISNDCRAAGMVLEGNPAGKAETIAEGAGSVRFTIVCREQGEGERTAEGDGGPSSFENIQKAYPPLRPPCRLIDQDLACLIYTSGSTGDPKGVMVGHNNAVFVSSSIISYLGNGPDDIVLNVLPLSFSYGLYQVLMVFMFGGTLVLEGSFVFPARILKRMEVEKVTGFPAVPTMFAILLKMDLAQYDLGHLRYLTNAAAALPYSHIREIRRRLPGAALFSMYGMTETKRTLYLPPEQLANRPGSVGVAIPGTEVWIEDEKGCRLGPNQIGELVIRGGHVTRGYWGDPEATAQRFRPGSIPGERFCYSGDIFRMDEEGYLYFVGRKDDIIKSRGEKVSPREVENTLLDLSDVVEAAVVGVPDQDLGEAIKAFVVVQPGSRMTESEILRHCKSQLREFMVPRSIEFREFLPKNANGKIQKMALA